MNEPLEERLRQHLGSLDGVAVRNADDVRVAVQRASRRLQQRRRLGAALASVVLVAGGAIAIWANRSAPTASVVTVATTTVATTTVTTATTTVAGGSWRTIPPDPRGIVAAPAAVWDGKEALVVGGVDLAGRPVGGAVAYDPGSDSWRRLADRPDGALQTDPIAVWTGRVMLVIGGVDTGGGSLVSAGESYDPATDAWRHIAPPFAGPMSDRSPNVWTGSELLVWPAQSSGGATVNVPTAYDPTHDAWRTLARPPIAARQSAASVWTGKEWIVWGGTTGSAELADGAAYDPATDTWRTIAASPLSARRIRGVWTGQEMIVDAGSTGGDPVTGNFEMALADGAAYDPVADMWRTITAGLAHPGFVPVWTGRYMVMFAKGSAVVYDVAADRWIDTCCSGQGAIGTPVWTGSVVIVVGNGRPDIAGAIFTPPG